MDRPIAYTQEQGRSTDFLFAQRSTMIAIAKISQAAFGSGTVVRGLAVTPNSPAALNVLVGIGEIYTLASVDATTYGSLPANTTDQIVQQGLNMAAQTISTPAPSTAGYSINYLIEAQFQPQDTNPVVLPFYNSANPQQPLNGQGGNGATLPTERQGVCVIQAKAGIAATTGTQVTPSVDSGWTALAVVTVANGQVSVSSGNISIPAGVPQITSLLQMMQTDATNYAGLAGGTANAITATLSPAPASYSDYLLVTVRVANTNTGSVSLNVNGLGVVPVIGLGHQVLQGGELFAGGFATFAYSTNYSEAILLECTGGALQVAPATQSQHAVQLGQAQTAFFGKQTLITSSTTFTVPAGVTTIYASLYPGGGGGGGGGSSQGSASTTGAAGGGGGGSAGTPIYKQAITVAPGQVLTATIGAAGGGGAGSTAIGTPPTAGTNGGNTTLTGSNPTVNLSATGGNAGVQAANANGSSSSVATGGGAGGANGGGTGTIGVLGAGYASGGYGGAGGSSNIGQGGGTTPAGGGTSVGQNGRAGTGYGAGGSGGSGGSSLSVATFEAGGNGGAGTIGAILLEW